MNLMFFNNNFNKGYMNLWKICYLQNIYNFSALVPYRCFKKQMSDVTKKTCFPNWIIANIQTTQMQITLTSLFYWKAGFEKIINGGADSFLLAFKGYAVI